MAKEIERKYLVINDDFKKMSLSHHRITQGYLSREPHATVRVRIYDDKGFITVKGLTSGAVRDEWEYDIAEDDARAMLALCGERLIDKTRWLVPAGEGLTWEVDEFHGRHAGLVVAEIELPSENTPVPSASFIGREVTGDVKYYNSSLV